MRPPRFAYLRSELKRLPKTPASRGLAGAALALSLMTVLSSADEARALLFMVSGDDLKLLGGAIGFIGNVIAPGDVAGSALRTSLVCTIFWMPLVIVYGASVFSSGYRAASHEVSKARGTSELSMAASKLFAHGLFLGALYVGACGAAFAFKAAQYGVVPGVGDAARFLTVALMNAALLAALLAEVLALCHLLRSGVAGSVLATVLTLLVLVLYPSAFASGEDAAGAAFRLSPAFYLMNTCSLRFVDVDAVDVCLYTGAATALSLALACAALRLAEGVRVDPPTGQLRCPVGAIKQKMPDVGKNSHQDANLGKRGAARVGSGLKPELGRGLHGGLRPESTAGGVLRAELFRARRGRMGLAVLALCVGVLALCLLAGSGAWVSVGSEGAFRGFSADPSHIEMAMPASTAVERLVAASLTHAVLFPIAAVVVTGMLFNVPARGGAAAVSQARGAGAFSRYAARAAVCCLYLTAGYALCAAVMLCALGGGVPEAGALGLFAERLALNELVNISFTVLCATAYQLVRPRAVAAGGLLVLAFAGLVAVMALSGDALPVHMAWWMSACGVGAVDVPGLVGFALASSGACIAAMALSPGNAPRAA